LGFRLGDLMTYRMDFRLLATALCFTAATFAIYLGFFDILVPSIPGGSVRSNSGAFFVIPVVLLLSGQTLFATWLTHVSITNVTPERKDALKAYFVASFEILLFSAFYLLFPNYGPYTFIVYFMPNSNFGPASYPVLVVWTLATVLATYVLIRWIFKLEDGTRFGTTKRLLLAAAMLALVMVMAS
jgi:hypothetical protein